MALAVYCSYVYILLQKCLTTSNWIAELLRFAAEIACAVLLALYVSFSQR